MKILHVVAGLNENGGGTSEVIPRMCEELVCRGHEVTLLTIKYGNLSVAAKRAMTHGVRLIEFKKSSLLPQSLSYSKEFSRSIHEYVRGADIIHLHCLWEWPCWKTATEAMKQMKPYVIQTHGFLGRERLRKSKWKKLLVGVMLEKPRIAHAARVIATAESEQIGLVEYGIKVPIEIVPIGLDTTEIDRAQRDEALMRRLGVPEGRKVLLYLSRLAPIKGLDMLAKAWENLSDFHDRWHLLIVGDDLQGYSSIIKNEYAKIITDGSVTFPGPIFGEDKFTLLKSADAFVLPTRNENFSIAVQEALAAGLPTVCTRGAPWAVIEEEGAGKWVDVSIEGITDGLKTIMMADNAQIMRMAESGRKIISRNFGWDGISTRLESVYESILMTKPFDRQSNV